MTLPDIAVQVVDAAGRSGLPVFNDRGQLLSDHEYRLEATTPTGVRITFHRGATADDVVAHWIREGWTS